MARASIGIYNTDGPGLFKCTCESTFFWRVDGGYECQRCRATWRESKSTKPRKQPESDAPAHVKAAKLELRRLGAEEREVRKRWATARAAAMHDMPYTGSGVWGDREKLGDITYSLWQAEHAREQAAARWRLLLAERETLPVAERWNQADLEAWASWSPGVV